MERTIEMALSEFVETDKELKTFEGPAYRALALQVAHYLGLNTDLVTKGENSSAICVGRVVAMFKPIEGTDHIQVELVGPLYNLEGITFTYKEPKDIYPLVNMFVKATGVRDTTEFQLVVGYNEESDIWSAKLYSIKKSDDSYDVDIDLVHEYSSLERRAVYTKALNGIEEVLGNQG